MGEKSTETQKLRLVHPAGASEDCDSFVSSISLKSGSDGSPPVGSVLSGEAGGTAGSASPEPVSAGAGCETAGGSFADTSPLGTAEETVGSPV